LPHRGPIAAARPPIRHGVEAFLQAVLDHPANAARWRRLAPAGWEALPGDLWREGLLLVYRLLFTRRAGASGALPCAVARWWREYDSPGHVLAGGGAPLEQRLRELCADLEAGFPDGARLFQWSQTPLLEACTWGDNGCARLLDGLLPNGTCTADLGTVHESLLDLEPGLATRPMLRLRRGRLEVVLPADRSTERPAGTGGSRRRRVVLVEEITPRPGSPGQFYLRPGLGRKTSGSYYTPPELARLLVRETLGPQVEALSPPGDPRPRALLTLTVLDPAMGSGHFLIEACRFLGEQLARACRDCAARGLDERLPQEVAALFAGGREPAAAEVRTRCKHLVAVHCLHGVDRDALAAEVARACLWLEVGSAALPWSMLDRHLIHGDSLTGPVTTGDGDGVAPPCPTAPSCAEGPPIVFDVSFPGVFYSQEGAAGPRGFHAVLCNPPWDAVRPAEKEFFAAYDVHVLNAPTARERSARIAELRQDPHIGSRWAAYRERIEREKACHDRLYRHQKVCVGNDLAGRYADRYRVFAERAAALVRPGGHVGLLVPGAFHASEGATGIRRLYLEEMALRCCYSFENRRRLFPIDPRCKFALVVARRGGTTTEFPCAFYLRDPASLSEGRAPLHYSLDFVRHTGGDYLTLVEVRTPEELEALTRLLARGRPLHGLEATHGLVFRTEPYAFNVTTHGRWFRPAEDPPAADCLPLLEGKAFHQFTDGWERPRYAVPVEAAARRAAALPNARHFRLAFRTIAHATNERTAIATVLPPGVLVANSVAIEAGPQQRPNGVALWACAVLNTFAFDFTVRVKGGANMNLFIMRTGLLPSELPEAFLAHAALRLVCNHAGFAPLWREQLGDVWREPGRPPGAWPVLPTEAERWQVRAAADAAVAAAGGLSRTQYAHVLGTFRHRSQPAAPGWCLERFDELERVGMEAYCCRHDPYHDLPLIPALPACQAVAR
jgi:hypothetical protein